MLQAEIFFAWVNKMLLPTFIYDLCEGNHLLQSYVRNLGAGLLLYYGLGVVWCFFIYYLFVNQFFPDKRKIPTLKLQLNQMLLGTLAMPIYVLLPTSTEYAIEHGMTRSYSYFSTPQSESAKNITIPAMIFHVACFLLSCEFMVYWIHRLLHDVPFLFKYLHHTHHLYNRDNEMSPWASVAFNPIDGFLQGSPYLINLFLIPIDFHVHLILLFGIAIWATNIHDAIHGDTEPIMGSKYHLKHHLRYNVNYGQYLILMDYIFGTLDNRESESKRD